MLYLPKNVKPFPVLLFRKGAFSYTLYAVQNDRQKILDFIAKNTYFALTTHDGADADGIGAEIAMVYILQRLGKTVRAINASPVPERFHFMDVRRLV